MQTVTLLLAGRGWTVRVGWGRRWKPRSLWEQDSRKGFWGVAGWLLEPGPLLLLGSWRSGHLGLCTHLETERHSFGSVGPLCLLLGDGVENPISQLLSDLLSDLLWGAL